MRARGEEEMEKVWEERMISKRSVILAGTCKVERI